VVAEAVERVIQGDYDAARVSLTAIDFRGLQHERAAAFDSIRSQGFIRDRTLDPELKDREGPREAQKRRVYERDSFTCWFCQKRTIYTPVLMGLSARFSEEIPYRSANWRPVEDHILYWTCTASWDHRRPVARGGSSGDSDNIITTCYQCNDVRGDYLYTEIGWTPVRPPPSDWLGLSDRLDALYSRLGLSLVRQGVPAGVPVSGELPVGAMVRATIPNKGKPYRNIFRIDRVEGHEVDLSGMWRIGADRRWHVGRSLRRRVEEVQEVELLRDPAPKDGEPDE
jgi:5-methylcytosine-specific restriction endonuclease McrA